MAIPGRTRGTVIVLNVRHLEEPRSRYRILNRGVNRPQHAGQKKKSDRKIRNRLYKNQAFQPVNIRICPAEKTVSDQTAAAKSMIMDNATENGGDTMGIIAIRLNILFPRICRWDVQ